MDTTIKRKEPNGKQYQAEKMFIENNFSKEEISKLLGVSISTVNGWSYQFKWNEHKRGNDQARNSIIKMTLGQIKSLQDSINARDGVPTKSEASLMTSMANMAEKMESNTKLNRGKQAFKNLVAFLNKSDIELATRLKEKEVDYFMHLSIQNSK